jgi:hypothetical protein
MWQQDNCNPVEDLKKARDHIKNSEFHRKQNCFIPIPGTKLILLTLPETEQQWNTLYKITKTNKEDWIAAARELWG